MPTSDLTFAIGLISVLVLLPIAVIIIVRLLVPLPVAEAEATPPVEFKSLQHVWAETTPHLRELRNRLVKSLIAVAIGTGIGFWLVNSPFLLGSPLPDFMVEHLAPGIALQALGVGEVFISYMRIALIIGIALSTPVVVYQIVGFLTAPGGLNAAEKRPLFIALPFVTELFLAGLAFGWFFTIPAALQFLLTYGQSEHIRSQPSLESFISTVATLLLWNGAIFELPALIYLLAWLGLINTRMLARTRRYAIVIIVIAAAVITPTGDPYNLLLLAIPMYLLYELGILLSRLVPRRVEVQPNIPPVETTKP
jgi:sec-independent protein translocase protein TatC